MRKGKKNPEKKLNRELITSKLNAEHGKNKIILVLDHLKRTYNIGKIIRSAEVFSIYELHLIGTKNFDPYPAKGAIKRVKIKFFNTLSESINELKKINYQVFVLDAHTDEYLHAVKLPEKTALIIGHEEFGPQLTDIDENDYNKVKIKQYGTTESLNVSIASSIGIYEYLRQNGFQ